MTPEIRKAVIKSVMTDSPPHLGNLPDAIDDALAAAEAVMDARRDEHRELVEEEDRHRKAVAAIEVKAIEAKGKCRHWLTRIVNGGGYDPSFRLCELCAQELD